MTAAVTPAHVFEIGFGFWRSKVLLKPWSSGISPSLSGSV
jgi:hypothetical protein